MSITGYLSEFSLAELFRFLEQGNKVGLLTICTLAEETKQRRVDHYIWLNQGRVVAASPTLDQQNLTRLISRRGWLGDRAAYRLALQACQLNTPMGLCLKSQGLLSAEQLKLLFYVQVMHQVCALFTLQDGWFQFDPKVPLPLSEMTGLSAPASEVTLAGLRVLKDWSALEDKLPSPSSTLISVINGKPQLKLKKLEWQIWEFTSGTIALSAIAQQLDFSIEKVQQIAFRLIVSGLAEEMPMISGSPNQEQSSSRDNTDSGLNTPESTDISQSFLQNLVSFLAGKT